MIRNQKVAIHEVLGFLNAATTPEIRQQMANRLAREHDFEEFYEYGSKSDWMDLVAKRLVGE